MSAVCKDIPTGDKKFESYQGSTSVGSMAQDRHTPDNTSNTISATIWRLEPYSQSLTGKSTMKKISWILNA